MSTKARKTRRLMLAAPSPTVTIEMTEVETLPPHQQAAWDWFAAQVRARIARRRQQQDSSEKSLVLCPLPRTKDRGQRTRDRRERA